jgi:putative alpha-1,2-mannosidase
MRRLGLMRRATLAIVIACLGAAHPASQSQTDRLTSLVDPFIGTGGHGHTYPGPSLPFGMIQPGPDTRLTGWDSSSGYHYSDSKIVGFSHTHLSGTGFPTYNDVLLMPTTRRLRSRSRTSKGEREQTTCRSMRRASHTLRYKPRPGTTPSRSPIQTSVWN